ncbi:hypothetical protein O988_06483 [Pseudogymnoascus sp. VKM F-3808]|nr:hypothetical protein O988_06483 [Pseudogymnoascus sp. VKM F-3808]
MALYKQAFSELCTKKRYVDLRRCNPALRTRIVQQDGDMLQVVTNENIAWREETSQLQIYKQSDIAKPMKFGGPLARYAIIQDGQERYLVWTLLHSIFDRWSKILIFEELRKLFQDPDVLIDNVDRPAYRNLVKYVGNRDKAEATNFWKKYLDGLERFDHVYEIKEGHEHVTNAQMTKLMDFKKPQNIHITFSTITHVAWALTLGNRSKSDDIFFVAVRSGRQLPLADVDKIIGPIISYIPVRIRLDPKQPLRTLLQAVHEEIISTTLYEPFGAEYAKQRFGGTGYLQCILMPQPVEPDVFSSPIKSGDTAFFPCEYLYTQTRANTGLFLSLVPKDGKLKLWARYDNYLISEEDVASMLSEYINNIQTIISALQEPSVGDIWHGKWSNRSKSKSKVKATPKTSRTLDGLFENTVADSPTVIIPGRIPLKISCGNLKNHIQAFQKDLADIGITKGLPVSISLPNSYELVIVFLASTWQHGIAAPLNPAYKQDEFEFYIDDLGSALVIVPKGAFEKDGHAVRAGRKYNAAIGEAYWDGKKIVLHIKEREKLTNEGGKKLLLPYDSDTALVLHTSGTTGRPKAVPLSHENLTKSMSNLPSLSSMTYYAFIPHPWHYGFVDVFIVVWRGSYPPNATRTRLLERLRRTQSDLVHSYSNMHRLLLKFPPPSSLPRIRFIRSCSSPLSEQAFRQLEERFKAPVLEAYAMTEASHQMTSNPPPPAARRAGSVRIPQGVEICLLEHDCDTEVSTGKEGEISIRGKNVTKGYLNNGAENKKFLTVDGFFRTGDQGKLDEDGYLTLTGRIKEFINKGGEKISPVELDNVAMQHRSVAEAVTFAIDDEDYGQEVGMAIKVKEGEKLDGPALKKFLAEKITAQKLPKKVWFPEVIPKTATGKVQRQNVAAAMISAGN